MPELPEVEVVKKSLEHKLKNLTIKRVIINNYNLRYKIDSRKFYSIKGQKIISVNRRSKYLLINLNSDFTILAHLGMTGKFFIIEKNNKRQKTSFYYSINKNESKHDHLIFYLEKGIKLIYNDVRKFGFIKILKSKNIFKSNHLKFLGPEPLSKYFNLNYVSKYLFNKKKKIKDLLMDQKFVAGLGNIYCNEILFLCKLNPLTFAKKISIKKQASIVKFTKKILKTSITKGGSSIKNFANIDGKNGNFQQKFNVYDKEKSKCNRKNCSGIIQKIYNSNRSSFFCPSCQK
ncbi:MAG: bifunctional DNA-formamidopyrimidine glycosylase/DNA-(apurinic or apyrimidinic site) lyase [Proteobacteria bacterium]|nr:bifunctional DNA-formamidopyrimidine glycosylase/DNA-(apurinic or apyrimidinic site) lyase [Pseudomonadota bacterium]